MATRIEHVIVRLDELEDGVCDSLESVDSLECETILQTLSDLGDILWQKSTEPSAMNDIIVIEPQLVIDFIREIVRHNHDADSRHVDPAHLHRLQAEGLVSHAMLITLPLWCDLNPKLVLFMKDLLFYFQLRILLSRIG